jgi:hypothetical protein
LPTTFFCGFAEPPTDTRSAHPVSIPGRHSIVARALGVVRHSPQHEPLVVEHDFPLAEARAPRRRSKRAIVDAFTPRSAYTPRKILVLVGKLALLLRIQSKLKTQHLG